MMGVVAPGVDGPIASYGKRVLALLLDGLIASIAVSVFYVPAVLVQAGDPTEISAAYLVLVGLAGAVSLALGLTQVWLEGSRGWTIGKRMVSVRTLDATTARPVGFGRAFVRQIVKGLVSGTVVGLIPLALSPRWDKTGRLRAWHDQAAGTVVLDGLGAGAQRQPTTASFAPPSPYGASGTSGEPRAPWAVPLPNAAPVNTPVPLPAPEAPAAPVPAAPIPAVSAPAAPRSDRPAAPVLPEYLHDPAPAAAGRPPHASELGTYRAAPALPSNPVPLPPVTASTPAVPPAPPTAPPAPAAPPVPSASATTPAPASGVISAVPGFPARRADPTTPPAAVPAGHSSAPTLAGGQRRPVPVPELSEDLDMTRLKPSREAVAAPSPEEVEAEIPPSALLRLSDGQEMTVTETVLIGRNPSASDGETVGELFRVPDPGRSVSKTHLLVGVDDEGVWVVDRASTNGTIVTLSDGQQIICAAHQVVRLPDGAAVGFGDYSITFEYRNS